jgi:hypothetical protein
MTARTALREFHRKEWRAFKNGAPFYNAWLKALLRYAFSGESRRRFTASGLLLWQPITARMGDFVLDHTPRNPAMISAILLLLLDNRWVEEL